MRSPLTAEWTGYATAITGIVLATGALAPFQSSLSSTTVALAFLLVVLLVAIYSGSRPALIAALLGVASFNFFFLPPLYTFTIAASQNWVALVAFLVTALTVGQLSARAREKAEEAERQRQEIEQLYSELKAAIDKVSEAEAIRRSEQLKSALLDAVTHDLRTPLTSIKASVTTLLDASETEMETSHEQGLATLDEEGQRELLEVINEEADRLNHFIEGMVELARIEAGELSLQQRWSSVEDIIASAVQRAAGVTARHHVEVHITEHLPAIRVDAHAVAEVIYTLLDNAAKYAPPGTTIRIGAQHPIELIASEMILLTVEDEGPGIPVELREKVFDKFFRVTAQAAALPRSNGLGMGLAIVRGIVNAHGGRIRVESGRNGKGARFILTLPIGDTET